MGYNSPWGRLLRIYRPEGDTLTLCLNPIPGGHAERPKKLSSEGRKGGMYLYQRVKE